MLHLVKYVSHISIVVGLLSCNIRETNDDDFEKNIAKRDLFVKFSRDNIDKKEYNLVLTAATDSIKNWTINKLLSYEINREYGWYLDSLLCFNKKKDKCIMALSYRLPEKESHDGMDYFYGVKIENKWYFFKGPNIFLPRKMYQKDIQTPLSFEKLHEIAMDNIFKGYLKKDDKTNKLEINDHFFDQLDYSKWGFFDKEGRLIDNSTLTQFELDSLLLEKAVYSNWRDRDSTSYNSKP